MKYEGRLLSLGAYKAEVYYGAIHSKFYLTPRSRTALPSQISSPAGYFEDNKPYEHSTQWHLNYPVTG